MALAIGASVLAAAFYCDAAVREWIVLHRTRGGSAFMGAVSRYGDWPSHILLGVALAGVAYAKGSKRLLRIFVAMILACAVAGAAARVIKVSVGRARPTVRAEAGWNGPRWSSKYNAFPSGHTASSTAFFGVLVFARWRAGAALCAVPLLIALSRMYVGAHHLSDVTGAALLGLLTAWLISRLLARGERVGGQTIDRTATS
ncbi:MAG: phosphatase PAP2 family protein [Chthoniobacterales bacterium]|nr:phosphatase PAP2 family protein [Chthoniobacterales bacterium]